MSEGSFCGRNVCFVIKTKLIQNKTDLVKTKKFFSYDFLAQNSFPVKIYNLCTRHYGLPFFYSFFCWI